MSSKKVGTKRKIVEISQLYQQQHAPNIKRQQQNAARDARRRGRELKVDPEITKFLSEHNRKLQEKKEEKYNQKILKQHQLLATEKLKHEYPILAQTLDEVLGQSLTINEFTDFQNQYKSNPERCWSSNTRQLECSYDDTDNNSLVWNTSKHLADILAPRTIEAIEAATLAVQTNAIDIFNVDCYLPVRRHAEAWGFSNCADCGYTGVTETNAVGSRNSETSTTITHPKHFRKMSILRLWAGCLGGFIGKTADENDKKKTKALVNFFRVVLLPSGVASRYNEPFNCAGETLLKFILKLRYEYNSNHNTFQLKSDPAVIIMHLFPIDSCLDIQLLRRVSDDCLWQIVPAHDESNGWVANLYGRREDWPYPSGTAKLYQSAVYVHNKIKQFQEFKDKYYKTAGFILEILSCYFDSFVASGTAKAANTFDTAIAATATTFGTTADDYAKTIIIQNSLINDLFGRIKKLSMSQLVLAYL